MRLLKFLSEAKFTWEDIEKLCPEAVEAGLELYRGMQVSGKYGKREIKGNRRPTNTSIEFHKFIDKAFKVAFGVNARSNATFCTGNLNQAGTYGPVYRIYPPDNFTIVWSDKILDLFTLETALEDLKSSNKNINAALAFWALLSSEYKAGMDDMQYYFSKNKELYNFIFNELESYKDYFNLPEATARKAVSDEINKKWPNAGVDFVKAFYQKGTNLKDLEKAIASDNEIMLCCPFYCWAKI